MNDKQKHNEPFAELTKFVNEIKTIANGLDCFVEKYIKNNKDQNQINRAISTLHMNTTYETTTFLLLAALQFDPESIKDDQLIKIIALIAKQRGTDFVWKAAISTCETLDGDLK